MATRSDKRREKHKRKRQEKKQQQRKQQERSQRLQSIEMPDVRGGNLSRHQQRILSQVPEAWPGESPEDVAVFDDGALEQLPPELSQQALAVRDALHLACQSQREEALKSLASIPRSSPYSEWRLFLRGLVAWLENDHSSASEVWERLDFERRPGRIATVLMNACDANLETVKVPSANAPPAAHSTRSWTDRLDDRLLYHAKLVRRIRFDRAALKVAQAGIQLPGESPQLLLGPRKLQWLVAFAAEHRQTEPELVKSIERVALRRAFAQDYGDIFLDAAKLLEGPPHDRHNLLLSHFYFSRFRTETAAEAEACLRSYLTDYLPKNQAISAQLRAAITSQLHFTKVMQEIQPPDDFQFFFDEPENKKDIISAFKAAITAYPANRAAHKLFVGWINSKLDNDRLQAKERPPLEKALLDAMRTWTKGLPDDVEPRLWLVDHLLENELTEEAKPHVEWMTGIRHEDPRVRATPWKWHMLEAMRLCRRKAWFSQVTAPLDEAERLWPAWLPNLWLRHVRAAFLLRSGQQAEFASARESIWNDFPALRGKLEDHCMMLAAAQWMRVSAADLKPLRAPVDTAVRKLRAVTDTDLLRTGVFFWDLHRAQLLYPAYRMHGRKIAAEICCILRENSNRAINHLDDIDIHSALFLCAEHRCFEKNYTMAFPAWMRRKDLAKRPEIAAARIHAFLRSGHYYGEKDYVDSANVLRTAAEIQKDAYYRYWFVQLADRFDEQVKAHRRGPFGFANSFFPKVFGFTPELQDDDELDDGEDQDP